MSKSLVEFKRFLVKSAPTLSEYEKKLANLILGGFDEIAAVGSAGGRRGKVLAKLIVDKGETSPPALEIAVDEVDANESEIVRLTKVEVEHFRGFSVCVRPSHLTDASIKGQYPRLAITRPLI
ncbi:hypothetical protein [Pseudomonas coronafaciens]|uniref:hypothetical protein n=1 Tax=Pseudomonas coronafaciens TaxID=53409 RepID=UPI0005A4DC11|nr:hypothetical protein [Pseudomonas coronafaciens]KGS13685.1 hypothetical protein OA77_15215 [Pseudomonas coronafaciens]RMV08998.1 SMC-like protein [Pseudomonas coronafaciens pv. coronafaciens]